MIKFILISAFLISWLFSQAQTPWYRPIEHHQGKSYFIEITGGLGISNMHYSGDILNNLTRANDFQKVFGAAYRYQMKKYISIAPTLLFETKGVHLIERMDYLLKANYLTVCLPLEYNIKKSKFDKKKSRFFVSAGPYVSTPVSGKIQTDDYTVPLSKANINLIDYGVEIGAGARIITCSLEGSTNLRFKIAYCYSIANSYSPMELRGESNAVNLSEYRIVGERNLRGIRFTISFEIPFEKKANDTFVAGGDGKKNYKRYVNIR